MNLTEEKFNKWKENEFTHVVKKIARMEGMLWVVVPLMFAILSIVIALLRNGD